MTVEVLYFAECPNYEVVVRSVKEALARVGASDEVALSRIATVEDAEREKFLGSPTVRIDGHDIEPGAGDRRDYGLKCRLYRSAAGVTGVPPQEWIMAGIEQAPARPARGSRRA